MAEAARKQVRLALEGFRGVIGSDNIQGIEIVDERGSFFEPTFLISTSDMSSSGFPVVNDRILSLPQH